MTQIIKETVLRKTAVYKEDERPEIKAGVRTTIVVTRAVIEDVVGGTRSITVYGYRKEAGMPSYSGWAYAGHEPKRIRYSLEGSVQPDVWALARALEIA